MRSLSLYFCNFQALSYDTKFRSVPGFGKFMEMEEKNSGSTLRTVSRCSSKIFGILGTVFANGRLAFQRRKRRRRNGFSKKKFFFSPGERETSITRIKSA